MSKQRKTTVFYHLPKTAGTTMNQILSNNYPPEQMVQAPLDTLAFVNRFKTWSKEKQQSVRLLQGHFPFGVHTQLPQETELFTIVRNPVERVISTYSHASTHSDHYLYDRIHANGWSLHDMLQKRVGVMLNDGQTRLLSGVWGDAPFGHVDETMLQTAVANLQQCRVVGLTEQFDASLILLRANFNWRHIFYSRANVSKNRLSQAQLSPKTIALIEKYNQQDLRLYQQATLLFRRQKRALPAFWLQLKWFQFRQMLYQRRLYNNGRLL